MCEICLKQPVTNNIHDIRMCNKCAKLVSSKEINRLVRIEFLYAYQSKLEDEVEDIDKRIIELEREDSA